MLETKVDLGKDVHLLLHSANACNSQTWAKAKPGAENTISVSHMGGRDLSGWIINLPRCVSRKLYQKLRREAIIGALMRNVGIPGLHLTH